MVILAKWLCIGWGMHLVCSMGSSNAWPSQCTVVSERTGPADWRTRNDSDRRIAFGRHGSFKDLDNYQNKKTGDTKVISTN
jgi:hypothetical protein